jgi:hypothetical protein
MAVCRLTVALNDLGVDAKVVEMGEVEVELPGQQVLHLGRTERMPDGAKDATLGSEFEPLSSALSLIGASVRGLDGAFFVQVPPSLGHPSWKIVERQAEPTTPVKTGLVGVVNDPDEFESAATGR